MVLVSGFGDPLQVMGTRFFVMRHKFLLYAHFFVMRHRNIVMCWRITKKLAHYKKRVGALQKNGRITKKRVPITCNGSPKPETRTIANSGLIYGSVPIFAFPIVIQFTVKNCNRSRNSNNSTKRRSKRTLICR